MLGTSSTNGFQSTTLRKFLICNFKKGLLLIPTGHALCHDNLGHFDTILGFKIFRNSHCFAIWKRNWRSRNEMIPEYKSYLIHILHMIVTVPCKMFDMTVLIERIDHPISRAWITKKNNSVKIHPSYTEFSSLTYDWPAARWSVDQKSCWEILINWHFNISSKPDSRVRTVVNIIVYVYHLADAEQLLWWNVPYLLYCGCHYWMMTNVSYDLSSGYWFVIRGTNFMSLRVVISPYPAISDDSVYSHVI